MPAIQRDAHDWEWAVLFSAGVVMLASSRLTNGPSRMWGLLRLAAKRLLAPSRTDTAGTLGNRAFVIREKIVLAKPPSSLFAFWRDLRNLPHVISHLEHVDLLEGHKARWIVRGPAGRRLTWQTVDAAEKPGRLLAWRSAPGSEVIAEGRVSFRPLSRQSTEVEVTVECAPPPSRIAEALTWLAGQSPAALVRADLRRLKQLIETGAADDEKSEPTWTSHWAGHRV